MGPNEDKKTVIGSDVGQIEEKPYDPIAARRPPLTPKKEPKFSKIREHLTTIIILIAAPLLAVSITAFVFRTYQVDGPSMEITLQDNDRLIINKIPRTWANITNSDYVPERYDVIVFNQQGKLGENSAENKQLIKRVIGLPGDRIVIKNGTVTVYNEQFPDGFDVDKEGPHASSVDNTPGNIDQTIQDGEVFTMGDNRNNSLDSRNLGTVKSDEIIGKLSFRVYPFNNWKTF